MLRLVCDTAALRCLFPIFVGAMGNSYAAAASKFRGMSDVAQILQAVGRGEARATEDLLPLVYGRFEAAGGGADGAEGDRPDAASGRPGA
jgi:hypothetical protein